MNYINYDPPVYRPPSEGRSLLIQVTLGCSNNKCTYCAMYRSKKYRVRPLDEIIREIDQIKGYSWPSGKVFLCDGDALGAPMQTLVPVIEHLKATFPKIRRFGIYATAENILEKTDEELSLLHDLGLSVAYLGMESGCDKVLKMVVKGNTAEDMLEAGLKLKRNGWKSSIIAMLGLGGLKHSETHTSRTAELISKISPNYFSLLTTVAIPGTPYARMVEKGLTQPLTIKQLMQEMYSIIDGIEPTENDGTKGNIIFRANHVSNMYPLGGTLSRDTPQILRQLKEWIEQCPDGVYPEVSPESL